MRGFPTGLGIVFGAALGLLFGLLLFDSWWLGPTIGVAAGLLIGAVADLLQPPDDSRRGARDDDAT